MKLLLVLVAVIGVVWLWRNRLPADQRSADLPPQSDSEPINMTRCSLCGVHVPEGELVLGKNGAYCSDAHLHQREP